MRNLWTCIEAASRAGLQQVIFSRTPPPADIAHLHAHGIQVLAEVTAAGAAREAEQAGVDGLVVKGNEAGGTSAKKPLSFCCSASFPAHRYPCLPKAASVAYRGGLHGRGRGGCCARLATRAVRGIRTSRSREDACRAHGWQRDGDSVTIRAPAIASTRGLARLRGPNCATSATSSARSLRTGARWSMRAWPRKSCC